MTAKQKVLVSVFCLLFLIAGYSLGYVRGHQNLIFEKNYIPKLVSTDLGKPKNLDFSLFWDVWNKVLAQYPGTIDQKEMLYGSINGMLTGLGDPYSIFFKPSENQQFQEDLQGVFEGIGVELVYRNQQIVVVSALPDSPAAKVNIKPKDVVLKVNGQSVADKTLDEVVALIRGKSGTSVTLSLYREKADKPIEVTLVREKFTIKSLTYEMKDGLLVIKVRQFGDDTDKLMKEAADYAKQQQAKGIVLDLRDNPGGYLDGAISMVSYFVKDGVVVKEKYKDNKIEEHKVTGDATLSDIPLVVLVNDGSASASEIVAGALQDDQRAKLVGVKTYGKGSVQDFLEMQDKTALKLTIAKWLTPKDREINGTGIEPDIKVELSDQDIVAGKDPQMEAAVGQLKK